MIDFICNKQQVRDILEYHQLKCVCDDAYNIISNYLDSIPDMFDYNSFMKETSELCSFSKLSSREYDISRFYNAFKERMRRYKLGVDWKDLNSKLPKMTRAKRTRIERQAKIEKINKNNENK